MIQRRKSRTGKAADGAGGGGDHLRILRLRVHQPFHLDDKVGILLTAPDQTLENGEWRSVALKTHDAVGSTV